MVNSITCPKCGTRYVDESEAKESPSWFARVLGSSHKYDSRSVQHFDNAAAVATRPQRQYQPQAQPVTQPANIPAGTSREVEHKRPEMIQDLLTYAVKSTFYGFAAGTVSIAPRMAINWLLSLYPIHWEYGYTIAQLRLPWHVPVWIGVTAAGVAWFYVSNEGASLITFWENLTRLDLDGDGKVGKPEKITRTVEAIVKSDGERHHDKRAEFTDDVKFHNLAHKLINGAPATEATAKRCGISRGRWEKIRDILVDRGWACWKDPGNRRAGVEILRAGVAALDATLPRPGDSLD